MARCGCQGAGSTTCEAIVRCVAASLGPGLMFNQSTGLIQTRLSRDGGNTARYGSDQGIYVPGGDIPPDQGGRTVDGLPDQVQAGTGGGAGLIHAYASPQGIEYAVANRVDIIVQSTWSLLDGVAAYAPYGPQTAIDVYTDNPSTMPGRELSSDQYTGLESDAGTRDSPTGRNSGAPPGELPPNVPDGGWYGFYAPRYGLMTATEMLRAVAARAVVMMMHGHEGGYDTQAIAQAILTMQAQAWVIPSVRPTGLSAVQTYLDLAIPHVGVIVDNNTTVTAQEIVDSGATWVAIYETQGQERVEEMVAAGLQVLTGYNARHTTAQEVLMWGVRGLISADPVYQRGALGDEWRYYRKLSLALQNRRTETGMLTALTDQQRVLDARGYPEEDEPGRFFQPEWGWEDGNARSVCAQLLGPLLPIQSPDSYRLSMMLQTDETVSLPSGTAPKLGFLVGSDNDLEPSNVQGTPAPETRHGYACFIRVGTGSTGELVIGVYSATGVYTELVASTTTQPVLPNTWLTLEVEVTSTGVTLRRLDGTPYEVTALDTTWRGPYAFHIWEDVAAGSGAPFTHGYQQVLLTETGAGGGVVWEQVSIAYGTWDQFAAARPTWQQAAELVPGSGLGVAGSSDPNDGG